MPLQILLCKRIILDIKNDIGNLGDIELFVNEFYKKVAEDDLLAPIFIGKNKGHWQPHLERMYLFWNAALFGEKGYVGNPFSKHITLHITEVHFERWLTHFANTIDTYFEGALATDAKWRAGTMADNFMRRLNDMKINGTKPIV